MIEKLLERGHLIIIVSGINQLITSAPFLIPLSADYQPAEVLESPPLVLSLPAVRVAQIKELVP